MLSTNVKLKKLYEIDDHLWLEETIKLLKANRLNEIDLENLIEELESLSRSDKAKVSSLLEQVIIHLLLLQYWDREYDRNYRHWQSEIISFRHQLEDLLTNNLKNYLEDNLEKIYQRSIKYVVKKTGLNSNIFSVNCNYSLTKFLDENWLP